MSSIDELSLYYWIQLGIQLHSLIFTFPDFSGDCLILSYDGGARRIGDGDPEADCAEVL